MIIFCEECGKRFIIDSKEIRGSMICFVCDGCNEIIKVAAPAPKTSALKKENKNK
jgi:DNA-directed RNA polymerase subunit M/transcription elongation factor TFIIS